MLAEFVIVHRKQMIIVHNFVQMDGPYAPHAALLVVELVYLLVELQSQPLYGLRVCGVVAHA